MSRRSISAFTKLDGTILIFAIGLIVLFLLAGSGIGRRQRPGSSVACTRHLKQVVLAFSLWQADRNLTNLPWEVAAPIGTAPDAKSSDVFRHFAAISNECQNFRMLICPADKARKPTRSWAALRNHNISYFINVTPSLDVQSVLAGDRNVSTNGSLLTGYNVIPTTDELRWSRSIHEHGGNVGMMDGSVHQTTTRHLRQCFTNAPAYLAIP